ncbi:GtrA family protein [Mesorhizobium retamae]|uniref:GtrA family protein n=1 Tax=Mesorhizobium retamae TaxID=2912854 RepID=A0ABS9QG36_9HYPH|nr:GtrA family protein [Mesorhizobium sp. IRAMC:0171]MCG7506401.1 GtrA family protein [Mesorhizobium sp. IRAMC:0171]
MYAAENAASGWRRDLAWAFVTAFIALAISAGGGFRAMTEGNGDNDSLLRLVQVRDLLAGQDWFDLHQYRMGPKGGFIMHWSRLVDAPLAALITVAETFGFSSSAAETFAKIVWPTLIYAPTVFFLVRATRRFGGELTTLPALVVAAAALFFLAICEPGNIDHHNVQLMLVAASLHFLLAAPGRQSAAILSGACAASTLAIGMETAPLVAAIGLCAAGEFLLRDNHGANVARGFGLGFAGISAAVFAATVAPAAWSTAACDSFSLVQLVLAAVSGLGLTVMASIDAVRSSPLRRSVALCLLGLAVIAAITLLFPQCLRSPYNDLDPRLRSLWLDNVSEAQSFLQLALEKPATAIGAYATPLIGLALVLRSLMRGDHRREVCIVGTLLAAAFAVSVWQVRGANFSIALAVIPLGSWVARWRENVRTAPSAKVTVAMIMAWLVSLNGVWSVSAASISTFAGGKAKPIASSLRYTCEAPGDYAMLATQPATTVLAVSNLGSPILVHTQHRVLAGPYHRNVKGNLLVLDTFSSPSAEAERIVRDQHVGLIALCRADAETSYLAGLAPNGFLATLMKGPLPSWLEPVAASMGKPLELYRVKPG